MMLGKSCVIGTCGLLVLTLSINAQDPGCCCSADALAQMSWCELDQIYRQAKPGPAPIGFLRGRVVYPDNEPLSGARQRMTELMWQGKHFHEGWLINQFCLQSRIRACIYPGESWLDGKPAIILDYQHTSHRWRDVRDEMRQVCPGVYLGAMYLRRCPCPRQKLFFILEETAPCCP